MIGKRPDNAPRARGDARFAHGGPNPTPQRRKLRRLAVSAQPEASAGKPPVKRSIRGPRGRVEAREAFTGRLNAMAQAQDMVTPSADEAVDTVNRTLAPYCRAEGAGRVILGGPKVLIPKDKATPLGHGLP